MPEARFEVVDGLIIVPVVVWGPKGAARRFRFVLDTGTARTILSERTASMLGFTPSDATRPSRVASILGAELGYVVVVPRIHSLGWERDDFEVACHGFDPDAQVAGLLGGDFFARMRLVIDYGTGMIEVSKSTGVRAPD
jgi:predicted aspartyl protease